MLDTEALVIREPFTLVFHTPKTHANPAIEMSEQPPVMREGGREVIRGAPDHPVELVDGLLVHVA